MRRSKIVCTIGPACSELAELEALFQAGMDVARLNFSHGDHAGHAASIKRLREVARGGERPLAILQDLSGPKVRLGDLAEPIELRAGQRLRFSSSERPGDQAIPVNSPELIEALKPGDRLLADDGCIEFRVEKKVSE